MTPRLKLILIPILIGAPLVACGGEVPAEEPAPAEARAAEPPVHRGEPHRAPLSVAFVEPPEAAEPRASLSVVLTSIAPADLRATVTISALSADGEERALELGSVTVPAGGTRTLSFRTAALPLQSTTHSAELVAVARFAHDGGELAATSGALAYHFERNFGRALVYSVDEMARAFGGGLVDTTRPPESRRVDGASAAARAPAVAPSAVVRFTGRSAVATSPFGATSSGLVGLDVPTAIDPFYCQNNPWNCCSGANCVDVCADWKTAFVDASGYEDVAKLVSGSVYQAVDAAYAHFQVEECAGALCGPAEPVVADRYLGPDGCVLLDLTPGKVHRLRVFTEHRKQGVDVITNYYSSNSYSSLVGVIELTKAFTAQSKATQAVYDLTLGYHAAGNAAAAVSRALTFGKPAATITVRAGVGCNGGVASGGIPATDACAPGNSLDTGPASNPDGSPGDLRWKFVLAHELGHAFQNAAGAMPSNGGYCFSSGFGWEPGCNGYVDPSQAQSALCRCDHVTNANKLHCIQSLERQSAAQIEGFAQFFSARAWNDPAGPDCDFNYYKQFNAYIIFGTVVAQPPVHLDCGVEVRWRDTFCFAPNMATEYDWMGFLWHVNAVGASTSSLTDLLEIWKLAKQSTPQTTWASLQNAAASYYGAGSAKYAKFVAAGDDFGVDDDQ